MKKQNKLGTYLAVTAGAGCAASAANAAVTFYGVNGANDTNSDPSGISFMAYGGGYTFRSDDGGVDVNSDYDTNDYFSRGTDFSPNNYFDSRGIYGATGAFEKGAVMGDQNYARLNFNGDSVAEAVAQFYFDGTGGGYLIAIATTNAVPNPQDLSGVGGPVLSISAGKALIDAASVPEPSSLALLALGSVGLLSRRNRKKAA